MTELRKKMIADFWQKLSKRIPTDLPNRLFIFAINRSKHTVSFSDMSVTAAEKSKFHKISIQRLPREEFAAWYVNAKEIHEEIFKKLYDKEIYRKIVEQYRYQSLSNICNELIGSSSVVVNTILDYESFR